MNQKMIIFEKLNHALACTKIVIFTFIFALHFSNSFKLHSDTSSFAVTITITHHCQPQSPPQHPTTASDVVWAPGKCFSSLMPHWLSICSNNEWQQQHRPNNPLPCTTTNVVGGMVMASQQHQMGVSAREDGCYKCLQGELGINGQQPYPHARWAGAFFTMSSMYYVYQNLFLSVQQNIIIYRFTTSEQ